MSGKIVVLMYHALISQAYPASQLSEHEKFYALDVEEFERQLDILKAENVAVLSLDEVAEQCARGESLPPKCVALTFDDSFPSHLLAAEILVKRGWRATFFLTTNDFGHSNRLTRAQARSLASNGMFIGSHTATHRYLDELVDEEVRREISGSRKQLMEDLGVRVSLISAPGGRYSKESVEAAREFGYRGFACSTPDLNECSRECFIWNRVVVTRKTSIESFRKIINADSGIYARLRLKNKVRSCFKKILGNRLYQIMHSALTSGTR